MRTHPLPCAAAALLVITFAVSAELLAAATNHQLLLPPEGSRDSDDDSSSRFRFTRTCASERCGGSGATAAAGAGGATWGSARAAAVPTNTSAEKRSVAHSRLKRAAKAAAVTSEQSSSAGLVLLMVADGVTVRGEEGEEGAGALVLDNHVCSLHATGVHEYLIVTTSRDNADTLVAAGYRAYYAAVLSGDADETSAPDEGNTDAGTVGSTREGETENKRQRRRGHRGRLLDDLELRAARELLALGYDVLTVSADGTAWTRDVRWDASAACGDPHDVCLSWDATQESEYTAGDAGGTSIGLMLARGNARSVAAMDAALALRHGPLQSASGRTALAAVLRELGVETMTSSAGRGRRRRRRIRTLSHRRLLAAETEERNEDEDRGEEGEDSEGPRGVIRATPTDATAAEVDDRSGGGGDVQERGESAYGGDGGEGAVGGGVAIAAAGLGRKDVTTLTTQLHDRRRKFENDNDDDDEKAEAQGRRKADEESVEQTEREEEGEEAAVGDESAGMRGRQREHEREDGSRGSWSSSNRRGGGSAGTRVEMHAGAGNADARDEDDDSGEEAREKEREKRRLMQAVGKLRWMYLEEDVYRSYSYDDGAGDSQLTAFTELAATGAERAARSGVVRVRAGGGQTLLGIAGKMAALRRLGVWSCPGGPGSDSGSTSPTETHTDTKPTASLVPSTPKEMERGNDGAEVAVGANGQASELEEVSAAHGRGAEPTRRQEAPDRPPAPTMSSKSSTASTTAGDKMTRKEARRLNESVACRVAKAGRGGAGRAPFVLNLR